MPPLLFVAVVPPPEATAGLRDQLAALQGRPAAAGLRWESPSRWHVTVAFLGPVAPTEALRAELAELAATTAPLPLQVAGFGRFGRSVLWAGLRGPLPPVVDAVRSACDRAGLPAEHRPFHAHLTLARAGRGSDVRAALDELEALGGFDGPGFVAPELLLLRSGRPDYLRLAAWPLVGPGTGERR